MLTNPNSHVQPPDPHQSALARHLGSEEAAVQVRDDTRRRQRADTLRNRAIALALDRDPPNRAQRLSEIRWLRDQLSNERRMRMALDAEVAELADAIDYLRDNIKEATPWRR